MGSPRGRRPRVDTGRTNQAGERTRADIWMPKDLKRRLWQRALDEDRTLSDILQQAAEEYLERAEPKDD